MEQSSGCRRLVDKVAIVTGAGGGVAGGGGAGGGRAIALRLAAEGADVAVDDIYLEGANKVADEIRGLGRKALALGFDVTKGKEAEAMVKAALDEFGKIDILVNTVGVAGRGGGGGMKQFCDSTEEESNATIALTLQSTLNCSRAVLNHMIERKYGKIVNISSGAGVAGWPGGTAYAAGKAGVIGFTTSLSEEVAPYGIRVNCVCPSTMSSGEPRPPSPQAAQRPAIDLSGFGAGHRSQRPEEMAALVAFLASDEADFISGQNYITGARKP